MRHLLPAVLALPLAACTQTCEEACARLFECGGQGLACPGTEATCAPYLDTAECILEAPDCEAVSACGGFE